jgi:single-stranded DNA-specific DHH superfamily exonuclease
MSRVKVRFTEDYGPVTKLIPTLEEETDGATLIITVDDDMV